MVLVEAASVKREVGFAFRNLAFSPSRYQCHPVFPPLCKKAPGRGEWPVGGVLVFVRVLPSGQDTSAGDEDEADEERKSLTENATDSQAFHPAQHTPHHTGHKKQERVRQRKGLSVQQQLFGACCRGAVVVFLAPSTSPSLPSLRPVLPTLLGHPSPRHGFDPSTSYNKKLRRCLPSIWACSLTSCAMPCSKFSSSLPF